MDITVEDIILMHKILINESGGSHGIRDINLLESAVGRVYQTFMNQEFYNDFEKISVLACGLIKNHAFIDGNKRVGIGMMLYLLKCNNYHIIYTQDELIKLGLDIANDVTTITDLKLWIQDHR